MCPGDTFGTSGGYPLGTPWGPLRSVRIGQMCQFGGTPPKWPNWQNLPKFCKKPDFTVCFWVFRDLDPSGPPPGGGSGGVRNGQFGGPRGQIPKKKCQNRVFIIKKPVFWHFFGQKSQNRLIYPVYLWALDYLTGFFGPKSCRKLDFHL